MATALKVTCIHHILNQQPLREERELESLKKITLFALAPLIGVTGCKVDRELTFLGTLNELVIVPEKDEDCAPLLDLIPAHSVQPSQLSIPLVSIKNYFVSEDSKLPYITVHKDENSDLSYISACIAEDIRCHKSYVFHSPHVLNLSHSGKYEITAHSCVWSDIAHQKRDGKRIILEDLNDTEIFCSLASSPYYFDYQKKEKSITYQSTLRHFDNLRNHLHNKIIEFRNILTQYQHSISKPPEHLFNQLLNTLALRASIHTIVEDDFFNHSIAFSFRLLSRYNRDSKAHHVLTDTIEACASTKVISHMRTLPIPLDPYFETNDHLSGKDSASLNYKLRSLHTKSRATALAVLAVGGLSRLHSTTKKPISFSEINYHLNRNPFASENDPIRFGVGIAYVVSTALELLGKEGNGAPSSQAEVEFYNRLTDWAEDFIEIREEFLKIRHKLRLDRQDPN